MRVSARPSSRASVEYARIPKCAAFEKLNDAELEKECVLSGGDARLTVLDAQGRPLAHRGGFDHFARP